MKYFLAALIVSAIMATTVLASASDSGIHAPALRRSMHHQKRKCSSSKKHHHKSKHHGHHSSNSKSSSGSSSSNSSSSKISDSSSNASQNSDSTSSSSSSSTSGGASGTGRSMNLKGKQGLAWPNANGMNIKNFITGGVSFFYSWGATPGWDSAPIDDIVFCPMLWGSGGSGGNVDSFKKNVVDNPNGKNNKWKCVMGPNEVNQKGQADLSPQATCSLMRKYIMPLADQGFYVIGPSTTSAPNGLDTWYPEFKKVCPDVFERIDAISLHWYDVSTAAFKKYVQNWNEKMGKPVWITEFACQNFNGGAQCSKDDATAMMKEMSDWFLQQDYVVGFAPFGVMQNMQGVSEVNRLSNGNNPTSLFRIFANA